MIGRLAETAAGQPSQDQIRQLLGGCEQGNLELVTSLLDQGLNVDTADDEDITPLQVPDIAVKRSLILGKNFTN